MKENSQLQLVTLNQAVKLKELKFNLECDRYYALVTDYHNQLNRGAIYKGSSINNSPETASCPTVALALKWFRDEKGNGSYIQGGHVDRPYRYCWKEHFNAQKKDQAKGYGSTEYYDTYEAAESALLDELLKLYLKNRL